MKRLALLFVLPLLVGAAAGPSGTIEGPFGDVRLGGDVEFDLTTARFPGGDKTHYRVGTWPMVATWCYQDVDGDGVEVGGQTDDLVYAALAKPYFESGGSLAVEFLLGGGSSEWLRRGGPATCEAILYAYSFSGGETIVPLDSTGFFAAA